MEVDDERHAPAALPLGKSLGTHGIGDWVGPWDNMGYCRNSRTSPPPVFDSRDLSACSESLY